MNHSLIASIDKRDILAWLRDERDDSRNPDEAGTLGRVIKMIESGEFDG